MRVREGGSVVEGCYKSWCLNNVYLKNHSLSCVTILLKISYHSKSIVTSQCGRQRDYQSMLPSK